MVGHSGIWGLYLFSPMHMSRRPSSQLFVIMSVRRFAAVGRKSGRYEPLDDLSATQLEAEWFASVVAYGRGERQQLVVMHT